jgi:hypothetical protein
VALQRGLYCRKAGRVDELGLLSVSFNVALQRGLYCRKAQHVAELGLLSVSFNVALQRGFYCRKARRVDELGLLSVSFNVALQRGLYCRKARRVAELGLLSVSLNLALQRGLCCRRARPVNQTGCCTETLSIYCMSYKRNCVGKSLIRCEDRLLRPVNLHWGPYLAMGAPSFCFKLVQIFLLSYQVYDIWNKRNASGRTEVQPAVNGLHGGYPAKTVWRMFKVILLLFDCTKTYRLYLTLYLGFNIKRSSSQMLVIALSI